MARYVGFRDRGPRSLDAHVSKDGIPLPLAPSYELAKHSPTGFEWGYLGSGPSQLALALLLDVTGDANTALQWYQFFKEDHVGTWGTTWQITTEEIKLWLNTVGAEG